MEIIKHSWSDCSTKPGNIYYEFSFILQEIMPRVEWIPLHNKKKFIIKLLSAPLLKQDMDCDSCRIK